MAHPIDREHAPCRHPIHPSRRATRRSATPSRGATLASAAREAGYAPASARQRGCELYARGDLQRHIARLTAARAEVERDTRRDFIDRFERLFEDCLKHGERATALRALTAQLRLRGLDARTLERRAEAERDGEARADDLRDRMRAELYAEIRAEVLGELERIGRDAHGPEQERQEPAHEVAGAEQT
ncbi:MAG TPA: hypothetical protein VK943_11530, partial [Arenibaculum sp.]|nr:hypothetical protein [Arenibaculum sp.]